MLYTQARFRHRASKPPLILRWTWTNVRCQKALFSQGELERLILLLVWSSSNCATDDVAADRAARRAREEVPLLLVHPRPRHVPHRPVNASTYPNTQLSSHDAAIAFTNLACSPRDTRTTPLRPIVIAPTHIESLLKPPLIRRCFWHHNSSARCCA